MIDFHSHLMPGVDDGSETLEQSLNALGKMWKQGIECVITTPHFRASVLNNPTLFEARMDEIDDAWRILHGAAAEAYPGIRLERGVEMALDEPIRAAPDDRVRLAATQFMLVEFPWFTIPPNSEHPLAHLRRLGVTPIVAHPERYNNVDEDWDILSKWKRTGAFLQLNAGSVVGAYGRRVESKAWKILEAGLADYLCTDYHAWGEPITVAAYERVVARGGESQLRMLTHLNGERLLSDIYPTPVERLHRTKPKWRLSAVLKRTK